MKFLICFLFSSIAFADSAPKLVLGFGPSFDFAKFRADGYASSQFGGGFRTSAYLPLNAYSDLGLRTHFFSTFSDSAGVGGGIDSIYRWFPYTYSRIPDFSAGPQKLTFKYKWMPYIGVGLGINFQVVDTTPLRRVFAILPKIPFLIGSYFPLRGSKYAVETFLEASYGQTIKAGGVKIEALSVGAYLGFAFF